MSVPQARFEWLSLRERYCRLRGSVPRTVPTLIVRARILGPSMSTFLRFAVEPPSPQRSMLMKQVRRENTAPEMSVRRFLHAMGLRYSLHGERLAGRPDLVLPRRRSVVFVHGCFWHGHDCPHGSIRAKSNVEFWSGKLASNRERDARKSAELRAAGWHVEVVWECQACDPKALGQLARRLLRR